MAESSEAKVSGVVGNKYCFTCLLVELDLFSPFLLPTSHDLRLFDALSWTETVACNGEMGWVVCERSRPASDVADRQCAHKWRIILELLFSVYRFSKGWFAGLV